MLLLLHCVHCVLRCAVLGAQGSEKVVIADARARDTWLRRTKCVTLRQHDTASPLSSRVFTSPSAFVRKDKSGPVSVWCRSDADL